MIVHHTPVENVVYYSLVKKVRSFMCCLDFIRKQFLIVYKVLASPWSLP